VPQTSRVSVEVWQPHAVNHIQQATAIEDRHVAADPNSVLRFASTSYPPRSSSTAPCALPHRPDCRQECTHWQAQHPQLYPNAAQQHTVTPHLSTILLTSSFTIYLLAVHSPAKAVDSALGTCLLAQPASIFQETAIHLPPRSLQGVQGTTALGVVLLTPPNLLTCALARHPNCSASPVRPSTSLRLFNPQGAHQLLLAAVGLRLPRKALPAQCSLM